VATLLALLFLFLVHLPQRQLQQNLRKVSFFPMLVFLFLQVKVQVIIQALQAVVDIDQALHNLMLLLQHAYYN